MENNKYTVKRDYLIDVMKGLAIFLVVIGHSIGNTDNPVNKVILSFHMSVFFFCSGMLWNKSKQSVLTFLKKKVKKFIFPQIIIGILNCVWYGIILCVFAHKDTLSNLPWSSYFLTWFLPTMLYSVILFRAISNHVTLNFKCTIGLITLMLIIMSILNTNGVDDKLHFTKVPFALFFIISGYLFKEIISTERRNKILEKIKYFFPITIAILCILNSLNTTVLWYENNYGNLFYMIICSFTGIVAVMQCSYILYDNKVFRYWGKESMKIYTYQFIVYRCLQTIFNKIIKINCLSIIITTLLSMIILSIWLKFLDNKEKIFDGFR